MLTYLFYFIYPILGSVWDLTMPTANTVNNNIIGNLSELRLEKDDWNNYIKQNNFFSLKKMVLKMVIKRNLYYLVHAALIPTSYLKRYLLLLNLLALHMKILNIYWVSIKPCNQIWLPNILNLLAEIMQTTKLYLNTRLNYNFSQYCDYRTVLNYMLWDRLVCGVNHYLI